MPISLRVSSLISLLALLTNSFLVYAGEGSGHTHDSAGDWKTMAIVIIGVIAVGVGLHYFNKKK